MRILILGASGLLGNGVFRVLSEERSWDVVGTIRSQELKRLFSAAVAERLVIAPDLEDHAILEALFKKLQPRVVVNCIALRKGPGNIIDPMKAISVFSVLPHRLARLCRLTNARLIHISSDGVFSGRKGNYTEDDLADASDIYGVSKFLGEVSEPHTITIRTSILGHELQTATGLLEWFLAQKGQCKCFTRAIFSGFPTVVLAQIIRDVIIPKEDLVGIYHVAASPISKFDLLSLVAEIYEKAIDLIPNDQVVIDRSLVADKFRRATGYNPPDWRKLIQTMHSFK